MKFLSLRSSPELDALLDAEVERLRAENLPPRIANKSAVARTLLLGALGQRDNKISGGEALKLTWGVLQATVQRCMHDLRTSLPQYVKEELENIDISGDDG